MDWEATMRRKYLKILVPDILAAVVAARLGTIAGDLRISGTKADASWNSDIPLEIGSERAGAHRLWARCKIAALMDDNVHSVGRPTRRCRRQKAT